MVVDQDDGARGEFERSFHHLAWIDRRVIDGAGLLHLVGDQAVLLVEEQDTELLAVLEGHGRAAIVEKLRPVGQDLTATHLAARHALGGGGDDLEIGRDRRPDALHLFEQGCRRAKHLGQGAEAGDQRLGNGLGVDAWDQPEEQKLEQFVVGQGVRSAGDEAFAQTVAVAMVMRLLGRLGLFPRRLRRLDPSLGKECPFVLDFRHGLLTPSRLWLEPKLAGRGGRAFSATA